MKRKHRPYIHSFHTVPSRGCWCSESNAGFQGRWEQHQSATVCIFQSRVEQLSKEEINSSKFLTKEPKEERETNWRYRRIGDIEELNSYLKKEINLLKFSSLERSNRRKRSFSRKTARIFIVPHQISCYNSKHYLKLRLQVQEFYRYSEHRLESCAIGHSVCVPINGLTIRSLQSVYLRTTFVFLHKLIINAFHREIRL